MALGSPAYALSINDPGVVGIVEAGTQSSNPENEREWSNYLLSLPASSTDTADGNTPADGMTENYATSGTPYSATLVGGTQVSGTSDVSMYQYVLAKYGGGPNGGYVLFYAPDYGDMIPTTSADIWTNPAGMGYGLSHYTAFSKLVEEVPVPDGGMSLLLLGTAFGGLGLARRFMS